MPIVEPRQKTTADVIVNIDAEQKWPPLNLRELLSYREILRAMVGREIRVRYAQTLIGVGWVILQPALTMIILSKIIGRLAGTSVYGFPNDLFVLCGLLPWTYFSHVLTKSAFCLVSNSGILSKAYFPRLMFPIATAIGALADLGISSVLLVAVMVYRGVAPSANILFLPAFLVLLIVASLGFGLWLAVLNLRHRDVSHALPFVMQLLFFCSPVAYPASFISGPWKVLYDLNPLTGILEGFRWSLLRGAPNPSGSVWGSFVTCIVILVTGLYYFRRREQTFADESGA